jgi:hypothetical protein
MKVCSFCVIKLVYISGRVMNFLCSTSSRPALGSTQPPIQCVPGTVSPEVNLPKR